MTQEQARSTKHLITCDKIAIFISVLALVLSYLGYKQSTKAPRLFITGEVTAQENMGSEYQPL